MAGVQAQYSAYKGGAVMSDVAVSLQGVSKHYKFYEKELDRVREILTGRPRYQKIEALKPVSLDVKRGEVLGVIGQNGAGKSTLLKVLARTLKPSSGDIVVNGRVAALLELGASFHPEMTGRENVYLSCAIQGLNHKQIEQVYDEIVAFAEIGDFIDRPVKTYSSGMFVRLAFAIATNIDPEILIIDEALSVGDGAFSRKSFDRIMDFKESGKTILFCSHSMYQVEALCDRVAWLEAGSVRKVGKPVDVISEYSELLRLSAKREESIVASAAVEQKEVADAVVVEGQTRVPRIVDVQVRLDGHEAKVYKMVCGESDLDITVIFDVGAGVPMPSVAVAISGGDGRIITSAGSVHDGVVLETNEEDLGKARIVFPALSLLRGNYFLDVALLCEKGIHLYETGRQVAEINVEQKGLERGFVKLPHEWKP
jgi:lipopolysaccharide transport system ATP-binding protein